MLFAYFGPETMLPVTSIIVAAGGVVMMFGRNVIQAGRKVVRFIWPDRRGQSTPVKPEDDKSQPGPV
jgi:hypothetical protein